MWPEFPSGMTFEQGARNPEAMTQLQADVDRILSFASTQKAEAYSATLGGKLSQVLLRIDQAQTAAIGQPDPRAAAPLEQFEAKFRALAAAKVDPIAADLADKKRIISEVSEILRDTTARFASSQRDYTAIVVRFKAYKATEAALLADFRDYSMRASASPLIDIPKIQTDVINYVNGATRVPDELLIDATRLRATMSQLELRYRARIGPYASFLETNVGPAPRLSVVAQRSLSGITAYCEQRRTQTNSLVSHLLRGIEARRDALVAAAADAATRTTFKQNAHLKASAAFLDEATLRNNEISKVPPRTAKYGFALWAEKYDQYISVLELEPLCGAQNNPARPSWRDTGCISFRRSFSRARTYTTSTIPQMIRLTIPQLRTKGVPESLLSEIQSALAQNRVRDAALNYDSAARLTENI